LRGREIPCKRRGGVGFFETKEVKFILDFISLLVNPKDMMAFIHIFENSKGIGTSTAKDIFHSLLHFGNGSFVDGVLKPKIFTLPKLNPNKNTQLGLFDDDLEIGAVSRFAHIDMSDKLRGHPLLKYPKLTQDGLKFFIEFYELFNSLQRFKNTSAIISKIVSSKLYSNFCKLIYLNSRARLKKWGDRFRKKGTLKRENIKKS